MRSHFGFDHDDLGIVVCGVCAGGIRRRMPVRLTVFMAAAGRAVQEFVAQVLLRSVSRLGVCPSGFARVVA